MRSKAAELFLASEKLGNMMRVGMPPLKKMGVR